MALTTSWRGPSFFSRGQAQRGQLRCERGCDGIMTQGEFLGTHPTGSCLFC
ncbi:hypothetical protein HMPREF9622_02358 [Cutibacterium modestum HL037PA3]|uniref:Uncharacterized protein n=1 Tax=Cutibacterium modestum HL044PA1 TaxID=765109 RepID=A0ABN0C862_9ACTN|nr:hypothetical protein HMPREF9621_01805 [Cutibacterium modestum HL037PA2]EFS93504.1 hypothetical protein HMPREF9607_00287 [Cutibacterium modestum HL044PA1]EFT14602.1 hypothetical protein HMPREF9622_02358 [Cutibacterium modestum HL037PA3]EGG26032.1 hypothetical protein PA08_1989 [Cutibacterium modestum P08]